jgi:hypothetical protein
MRILSLDGGGIRGVLTVRLLQRLDEQSPGFLDKVELFAGTSIGGINALFLAQGGSLVDLMDLYENKAARIFKDRGWWDRFWLDEIYRADFSHEDMYEVLTEVFGDRTMKALKTDVLIPVFDMRSWNTKFYERDDGDVRVRDVARMTSAAPTFWPSHLWSLDGGLFANNPSDCAITTAIRRYREEKNTSRIGKTSCLSISTGEVPHQPPSPKPNWDAGVKDMLPLLLNVIMDGGVKASHYRSKQALWERYHRINPRLPSVISLSDVSEVPKLIQIADLYDLSKAVKWLDDNWGTGDTEV